MRKRILIHPGFPKTGTTSIQRFLAEARAELSERGVLFPYSVEHNSPEYFRTRRAQGPHEDIMAHLTRRKAATVSTGINWKKTISQFLKSDAGHHTLVISAEPLSVAQAPMRADVFKDLAKAAELQFVYYLRSAPAWLESFYRQAVHGHSGFSGLPGTLPALKGYLQKGYAGYIAELAQFGAADIRNFDVLARENRLMDDFCDVLGTPDLVDLARQLPRANSRSAMRHEVLFLRALKAEKPSNATLRLVRRRLEETRDPKFPSVPVLPRPLMKQIIQMWETDKEVLSDQHGLEFGPSPDLDRYPAGVRVGELGVADLRRRLVDFDPEIQPQVDRALDIAHGLRPPPLKSTSPTGRWSRILSRS